ncbi:hypothetical protein V8F33_003900 [Rhypophila sp. PSN 637]
MKPGHLSGSIIAFAEGREGSCYPQAISSFETASFLYPRSPLILLSLALSLFSDRSTRFSHEHHSHHSHHHNEQSFDNHLNKTHSQQTIINMSGNGYSYKSSGTNSQGNHYCARDYGNGSNSYHYSNTDGSYYYSNPNGSTYHNNGSGGSTYTAPSGYSQSSGYGSSSGSSGSGLSSGSSSQK